MINLGFLVSLVFLPADQELLYKISLIGFIALNCFFLLYELYQSITTGLSYFNDIWNYMDIIRCPMCISWGVLLMLDYTSFDYYHALMIATNLLCWVRGLTYFRTFKYTRIFVSMVLEVTRDTSSFLILLFYTTLAYGTLIAAAAEHEGFFMTLGSAYSLDLTDFNTDGFTATQWVVFVIASIINCIIMLNLLISILGDSYERIQLSLIESDYSQMLEIIIELEKLMVWNRNKGTPVYLQECKVVEDEENAGEWEGRIRLLQDRIGGVKSLIDENHVVLKEDLRFIKDSHKGLEINLKILEENQKRLDSNQRRMEDSNKEISQNLQKMEEYHTRVENTIEEKFRLLDEKLSQLFAQQSS